MTTETMEAMGRRLAEARRAKERADVRRDAAEMADAPEAVLREFREAAARATRDMDEVHDELYAVSPRACSRVLTTPGAGLDRDGMQAAWNSAMREIARRAAEEEDEEEEA